MRVISGTARGRKLLALEGLETRPTADRFKEMLFNILTKQFLEKEIRFLDLFSGTGAIGIEALSRGAQFAVFVEHKSDCVELIRQNLTHCRLQQCAQIIQSDCLEALDCLNRKSLRFDIIFLDPPYKKGLGERILQKIVKTELLEKDGIVIVEQSCLEENVLIEGLRIDKVKEFKTTKFIFYNGGN